LNKGTGYFFTISLLVTLGSAVGASTAAADENLPNVVFIMADDMGWGDVQTNNPESLIPTPNIDRLAEEGLLNESKRTGLRFMNDADR